MAHLILDIATAPLANAADFITTDDISAPANYKDPEKIAAFCEAEKAKRLEKAALDPDTCRISAIGLDPDVIPDVMLCKTEEDERAVIGRVANLFGVVFSHGDSLITFNGFAFDLPVLQRRALYLGVKMPTINVDRYRSPHLDLCERLSQQGKLPRHGLQWYVKRLGWTDLTKTLQGAEEAKVFETGQWDELAASVQHDVEATKRLAAWMGL